MYEGNPYSDPNLHLPGAGAGGVADGAAGVVHNAGSLPMTGGDVVFYLVVVGALVLVGTLLVVLAGRIGQRG